MLASCINALISRRNAQAGANPLVTSSWQLTSACCVATLLLFVMPPGNKPAIEASLPSLCVLVYLGLVVSVGVYILSNYAVRHLPVARMSLLGCLSAPLAAMLSAQLLGTKVSTLDMFAVGLVIFAVALPSLIQLRAARQELDGGVGVRPSGSDTRSRPHSCWCPGVRPRGSDTYARSSAATSASVTCRKLR